MKIFIKLENENEFKDAMSTLAKFDFDIKESLKWGFEKKFNVLFLDLGKKTFSFVTEKNTIIDIISTYSDLGQYLHMFEFHI